MSKNEKITGVGNGTRKIKKSHRLERGKKGKLGKLVSHLSFHLTLRVTHGEGVGDEIKKD